MSTNARILADSISPGGVRLTTLEVTIPRIVLAEFNTHRVFSRNSASSRAIPVSKQIERVQLRPFVPSYWGMNQPGMVATAALEGDAALAAENVWLSARDSMVDHANRLLTLGVHKQITNRLLEPFMWQTIIVSATEWSNFFALRCHPDAQPEIREAAVLMREALAASTPRFLAVGEWHMPLTDDLPELYEAGYTLDEIRQISAGRCARVSYLTHDGVRDPQKDIELCTRLVESGHMSPLEHVATPAEPSKSYGNFRGWRQVRWFVPNEADFGARR